MLKKTKKNNKEFTTKHLKIRKADVSDIIHIQQLIQPFANSNEMLPRPIHDLIEGLRDFFVVEDIKQKIIACAALHITWFDIAEVRSLAISKEYQKMGIGKMLMENLIEDARKFKLKKIFALTYKPDFFKKFDFRIISKDDLPKKVWNDCIKCPKFPNCDEIAVIRDLDS